MLKSLGNQVTLERSHQKLVQKIMDIRSTIKQEDMITTDLEFDHAQIRNDILKVEQYNQNVRDTLEALETEIKQKLLIVSKMDTEIKRKQSEVDVKSKEIDRLNKQYDKLTINFVDKDQTPWHHMIANITYEISKKAKSSTQLQKQWLTMQNDLVTLTAENNCLSDKIQKLESDKAALVQRNKRLETELAVLAKNIKDLDKSMALNHNMIVR
jgi:chromosome segregation ATPase